LFLQFVAIPSPRGLDHSDDSLTARVNMNVLNRDLLLAFAAMAIESIEQHGVGARQLVGLI
jgi:hypothetical protein